MRPPLGSGAVPAPIEGLDPMITALLRPEAYDHPVGEIRLLQTHISWVLLTGPFAYKIKKPVNFGFVDFSTVERRRWFCQEELRLNQRLAPDLYVDLCAIHGPVERATFVGPGAVLELAVRMHQFDQNLLLPARLASSAVDPEAFEALAERLAAFHGAAAVAPAGGTFGSPQAVLAPALANLDSLEESAAALPLERRRLERLRGWTLAEATRLEPLLAERLQGGFIRECHGDLHLGNLVLQERRIEAFDCLEFSPSLRWIDPISDLAFLAMDLSRAQQRRSADRLLNRWLECSGDYGGLALWRWYGVYRALVRAKVTALRLRQLPAVPALAAAAERPSLEQELEAYLKHAEQLCRPRPPLLVLTHGVSGSGKSVLAARLVARGGWIRLRSDVERRRLFGGWGTPPTAPLQGDPYQAGVSELLYGTLLPAAAMAVLAAGLDVVVDATFLRRDQRQRFRSLARRWGAGFAILECRCPPALAAERIARRRRQGGDPSEADGAVLERQLASLEPLGPEEALEQVTVLASEVEDSYQVAANEKAVVRALEARRPLRNDPAGA